VCSKGSLRQELATRDAKIQRSDAGSCRWGRDKGTESPAVRGSRIDCKILREDGHSNDSLGAAGALTAPLVVAGVLLRTIMSWVRIGRKGRDVRVSPSSAFGQPGGRMGRGL
jgi:hypothetical protein